MIITILMWLVVGFLAGLLAKAIVPGTSREPSGFLATAVLGIVGAVVGGFIYHLVTGSRAFSTNLDVASILWAALGAIVVVFIERALSSRRTI